MFPWRSVRFWNCTRCGECCSLSVQLTMREWLTLTRAYGYSIAEQNIGGFFLRKTVDNNCPFLHGSTEGCVCKLQSTKPLACMIWPFRVLSEPRYGQADEAAFDYRNRRYYIYVSQFCPGIVWGPPTESLAKKILPEIIDIRLGFIGRQHFSTSH